MWKKGLLWAVLMTAMLSVTGGFSVSAVASTGQDSEADDNLDQDPDCADCYRVDAIVVEGLLRTQRSVIERELLFEEGDVATVEEIEESVQRLRNTGIFRGVRYEFVDQRIGVYEEGEDSQEYGPEGRLLKLFIDERWTLSPSFRFGQGGDTFRLTLGLQDVNLRGSYLQAGGSYTRFGDANSFSLWFRDPRFLGARQQLSTQIGVNNRLFTLYERDGDIEGGFMVRRRQASVGLNREWKARFRTGISVGFQADSFSYDFIADNRREAQEANQGLYDPMQTLKLGLSGQMGRLDRNEYRVAGTTFDARLEQNFHFGDLGPRSRSVRAGARHFLDLPYNATFGMRGEIGFSSVEPEHMQFFAGGLDVIRGTYDKRHRGPHHWYGNLEYRIPSYQNNWIVLQHVAFVDAVGVSEFATDVLDLSAATTGIGLRLISRDFHGLLLRLDYALPILGADGPGLSFGAGQFF